MLQDTFNYTITVVMMATSAFSAVFFLVLFLLNKSKGILMVFLSNVLQVAITVSFLILAATGSEWSLVAANIISVMLVVFWINAIFLIYDMTISSITLVAINSLGTFLALFFYIIFKDIHAVNVGSAFLLAGTAFYAALKASGSEPSEEYPQKHYSALIMLIFGALNIVRGLFRMFHPLDFTSYSGISRSASVFILICYGFSFIINYSVLYLNFDELIRKVEKMSYLDKLTGALSRNTFFAILSQKLAEIKRGACGICVAFLDIDNFKRINDQYGHMAGDEVLKNFVKEIKDNLRENDIVGRFGGEEFMLILQTENCDEAMKALERLRGEMRKKNLIAHEKITFSCGHIFIDKSNCDMPVDNIIKAIDFKMYEAKSLGKDRVV